MDNEMNISMFTTPNGFQYSSLDIEHLDADGYTIVNILVDTTGSVYGFEKELEACINEIVESCKKHPRSENLLVRVAFFDSSNGIREVHGFTLLDTIDSSKYAIKTGGATPLYAATLDCIETTQAHAKTLTDQEYSANAIFFVITDGGENCYNIPLSKVKDGLVGLRKNEECESIKAILIGVNDTQSGVKKELQDFKDGAGLDDYISLGDVTPSKLAKLAEWISQSISSTSQALGSGGPSQNVNFTI